VSLGVWKRGGNGRRGGRKKRADEVRVRRMLEVEGGKDGEEKVVIERGVLWSWILVGN
jgi:hypothetical protein